MPSGRRRQSAGCQGGAVPTRRIFELVIITGVLLWPAKATVKIWCKKQLATQNPGSVMHAIGEAGVTILS
jgi:hypothetical protein